MTVENIFGTKAPATKTTTTRTKKNYILDEFEQLKTYFRKGTRPSMELAIANFEKHLKELI